MAQWKVPWLLSCFIQKHVPGFNVPQFIRKLAGSFWLCRIKLHGTLSKSLLDSFNFCDPYLNDMCSNCLLPNVLIFHPCFIFWLKCNVQTTLYLQNRLIYTSYRTMPKMVLLSQWVTNWIDLYMKRITNHLSRVHTNGEILKLLTCLYMCISKLWLGLHQFAIFQLRCWPFLYIKKKTKVSIVVKFDYTFLIKHLTILNRKVQEFDGTYVTVWPVCTRHTWPPGLVARDSRYKAAMTTYGAYKAPWLAVAEYTSTDAIEYVLVFTHAHAIPPTSL